MAFVADHFTGSIATTSDCIHAAWPAQCYAWGIGWLLAPGLLSPYALLQVGVVNQFNLPYEVVGTDNKSRLRILPSVK